jgi:hypothetical protein
MIEGAAYDFLREAFGMRAQEVSDWLLSVAKATGAEYPVFAESADNAPVIVDSASGRTWKIRLEEFSPVGDPRAYGSSRQELRVETLE